MQTILNFITEYFWQIFAIVMPCLAGFSATQMWKASVTPKPDNWRIYLVSAGITGFLSTLAWLNVGDALQAVTIGVTLGLGWPLLVLCWFWVATKFAPQAAERLKGQNGHLTIVPWIAKKKTGEK